MRLARAAAHARVGARLLTVGIASAAGGEANIASHHDAAKVTSLEELCPTGIAKAHRAHCIPAYGGRLREWPWGTDASLSHTLEGHGLVF